MSVRRTYVGQAGQMALLAELLFRGCNVAVPEVDRGLDLFAFRDDGEDVTRVQIKTGDAEAYKKGVGHSVQFSIPTNQLHARDVPPLFYGLVVRVGTQWADYFIIPRLDLAAFARRPGRFGTPSEGNLVLTLQCRDRVLCGDVDLTAYRNAWHLLPPLQTLAGTSSATGAGTGGDG
jgi:hypothetical protein